MSVEPENTNTRFIDPVSSQFIASSMIKLLDFFYWFLALKVLHIYYAKLEGIHFKLLYGASENHTAYLILLLEFFANFNVVMYYCSYY